MSKRIFKKLSLWEIVGYSILIYISVCITIGAFKNPELTKTQLFLNYGNFIISNFEVKNEN